MANVNRRRFLEGMGALSAVGGVNALSMLTADRARAADLTGYKALVCVYLYGGMDHADVLLPYDQSSYDTHQELRAGLFSAYGANGGSRGRDALLPLPQTAAMSNAGRQHALAPEWAPVHDLYLQGRAAIVSNVGPLVEPTDRTSFDNRSVAVPRRLFSHSDQQATWMSLDVEGTAQGWGGRFVDAVSNSLPTPNPFSAVTLSGSNLFLAGQTTPQFGLSSAGPVGLDVLEFSSILLEVGRSDRLPDLIREQTSALGVSPSNLFERDIANMRRQGRESFESFQSVWGARQVAPVTFPDTPLSQQLKTVAETIALSNQLDVPRQIFFVGLGGFDTHSNQSTNLPALSGQVANAISSFYHAIDAYGLGKSVTLFTASDFGRTMVVNGNGTDHGWGGHQFVVGGAVRGGRIFGEVPDYDPDGARFTLQKSRMIPETSVEQFAASLGAWFGLSEEELVAALPNLANFDEARPNIL